MQVLHNNIRIQNAQPNTQPVKSTTESTRSFQDILTNLEGQKSLQFSKHAETRLKSRNIQLSQGQMDRIETGVMKASQKGIKDSLVVVDGVALLVNVNSKTVITAVDQSKDETVFTNIDGAVIV